MSNRLTQIATRTGDNGTTGLGDNTRVSKDSLRVHAMGDVDELNSSIGVLLCEAMPDEVRKLLVEVQHQLFNLGGELSIPGYELLKPEAVAMLDAALEEHNAALPRLAEFILPAGSRRGNFAKTLLKLARARETLNVINDQFGAPTLDDLLADVTAHSIKQVKSCPQYAGVHHLAAAGETTWFDYAKHVVNKSIKGQEAPKITVKEINAVA